MIEKEKKLLIDTAENNLMIGK